MNISSTAVPMMCSHCGLPITGTSIGLVGGEGAGIWHPACYDKRTPAAQSEHQPRVSLEQREAQLKAWEEALAMKERRLNRYDAEIERLTRELAEAREEVHNLRQAASSKGS